LEHKSSVDLNERHTSRANIETEITNKHRMFGKHQHALSSNSLLDGHYANKISG